MNVIKALSLLFCWCFTNANKPKPVVVTSPAKNVGKLITPFRNANAKNTEVTQFGIKPKIAPATTW